MCHFLYRMPIKLLSFLLRWHLSTHACRHPLVFSCNGHRYDMNSVWAVFKSLQVIHFPWYVKSKHLLCFSLTCKIKKIKHLIFVTTVGLFPAEMMTVMSVVIWQSDMVSQCILFFSFLFHKLSPRNMAHISLCKSSSVVQCDFSLSGQACFPWQRFTL